MPPLHGEDLLCIYWKVVNGFQVLGQQFSTLGAHGNHLVESGQNNAWARTSEVLTPLV